MTTYAIIKTGGKQYRVQPGDVIEVERLVDTEPGDTFSFDEVLLVSKDGDVTVGSPTVKGAKVVAKIEDEAKGDKILVFKYKRKVRFRRKNGHRQWFSRVSITGITA